MPDSRPATPADESALLLQQRLGKLARVLDNAIRIPGTRIRFGLDAVIGLIPGIGDMAGLALGLYLLWQARSLKAPGHIQARMLGNLGLEALIGVVPVLGDVFDLYWQANQRNIDLLQSWASVSAAAPQAPSQRRWWPWLLLLLPLAGLAWWLGP